MKVDRSCCRRRSRLNIDAVTNHRPGLNARRDEKPVRTYRHAMLPSATDVSRTFVYPDTCSPKKHHGGHLSLDAFLRRCNRLRHCGENLPAISSLLEDADNQLFTSVLTNTEHILHHYMPVRASQYHHHLRPRIHNKEVIHTPNP